MSDRAPSTRDRSIPTGALRRRLQGEPVKTALAILLWTLSLFGIEVGSQIRIDRIRANDTDVLYSRVIARPTGTRFECLRSASGQCYYTLFAPECTPGDVTKCDGTPVDHFALAKGGSRQIASLSTVRVCVSVDATAARPDCQ